ncbi:type I-E CRISPR-associated protein Cse1/CasA [Spiractinospora alimapuensis]|uniref:type I-E CRISPR-associated protein Cse1/CasA n=1 Tax=Spiractinospora alimapuensis TaxID=2820884 RepID=UPI001F3C56A0|nr:type I-E CRISPR-associated protein Cse1/CasA [Spiractinospora alimapuensis]QVQ51552.1 type I-E CRISPR-associated protein Cse1/CasA [Spiractinospora alimapuensis]
MFNLATSGFVTPQGLDGTVDAPIGLEALLRDAHNYSGMELPLPPAMAGLYRILALLAARVTGLDDYDREHEWQVARDQVLAEGAFDAEAITAYFDDYRDRFELFDAKRPWGQDPRLRDECDKSSGINKLVWGRPAGRTQVWLRHVDDREARPVPAAEAVHHLIATLYYGPSGLCSRRTANGVTAGNSAAGPLRGALSIHPVGRTLFETIVLNIPFVSSEIEGDPAFWERDELRDPTFAPDPGNGLAGVLTNQVQHAVLLYPSDDGQSVVDATVTWGARPPRDGATPKNPDPFQVYVTTKDGREFARSADASRAVWRDVDPILQDTERDAGRTTRPKIITTFSRALRGRPDLRIQVFGFDQDRQARDKAWFTAETPPVLHWLSAEPEQAGDDKKVSRVLNHLRAATDAAEDTGWQLERTLTQVGRECGLVGGSTGGDRAPWNELSMARYWRRAEAVFWDAVTGDAPVTPNRFISVALQVYDTATDDYRHRPRVARAVARNVGSLYRNWVTEPTISSEATEGRNE